MPSVYNSKVKVGGTWRTVNTTYVKVNGTWKAATGMYTKVGGAWKTVYPINSGTSVTSLATLTITYNGTTYSVLPYKSYESATVIGYTLSIPAGVTSAVIAATTTDPLATFSSGLSGTGSASATKALSTGYNDFIWAVTASDATTSKGYFISMTVAEPTPSVTIYYAFCVDGISQSASYTDYTTSTVPVACSQRQAALGYPTGWSCAGTAGGVTIPSCNPCPGNACCQTDPSRPEYCSGTTLYVPRYDPCCGTTCTTLAYPGMC